MRRKIDIGLLVCRQILIKCDLGTLRSEFLWLFFNIDGTFSGRTVLDRTNFVAKATPGAILEIHLQSELCFRKAPGVDGCRLKSFWCRRQIVAMIKLRTDHTVRADKTAVSALNARVGFPDHDALPIFAMRLETLRFSHLEVPLG